VDDEESPAMINERNNASEDGNRADAGAEGIDSIARDLTSSASSSPLGADTRPGKLDEDLLVCGTCGSRLMYAAECEEHGRDHWYIELKCPNCGGHDRGRFDLEMLDALDRELERAEAEIEADLECLTRTNMADYVTRFISALYAGAIEPEDFTA
jgi:hypothetical protein